MYFARRHLSFANVIALVSLFVALGGTSYAAIKITGSNVKDNSLTTRDVKNSSLLKKDFKAGQLPAGAQGERGPQGPQGPAGQPGQQGEPGVSPQIRGGAVATDSYVEDKEQNIQLSPGKWMIFAKTTVGNAGASTASVSCSLTNNGSADTDSTGDVTVPANGKLTLSTQSIAVFTATSARADLTCSGPANVTFGRTRISAVRVTEISD